MARPYRKYNKYETEELRDLVSMMYQNISMSVINKMNRAHLVILLNKRSFKGSR